MTIVLLVFLMYFMIVNYVYIKDINKAKRIINKLLEVIEYYEQQSRKNGEGSDCTADEEG